MVEDLARDRRFANNPVLKERGLRFYAGAPLRSNNLPIGSLCLLDIKPRRMTDRDKRLLEVMADDVMEEIKRRDSVGPPRVLGGLSGDHRFILARTRLYLLSACERRDRSRY